MFEFVKFMYRNPSYVTNGVRRLWATRKAMNSFRDKAENQSCAFCGRSARLEVHHIEPVSVAPDKADDEDNMIMLCRKPECHKMIGHDGDFRTRFVENVRDICESRRVVRTLADGETPPPD